MRQVTSTGRRVGLGWYRLLCIMMLFVAGCATTNSLKPTQDKPPVGLPKDYTYPRLAVFEAAQKAARELGLKIVEAYPHDTYFLAKRGPTVWDWGHVVGVYVLAQTDTITPVLVFSQPVFPANLYARDYALALHTGLRHLLTIQEPASAP